MPILIRNINLFNRLVFRTCAVLLTFITLTLTFNLGSALNIMYYEEQFFALALGCALFIAYSRAAFSDVERKKWHRLFFIVDVVLAWGCLAVSGYFAWNFESYSMAIVFQPIEIIIGGTFILLALLEIVRRIAGPALVVIIVAILAYGLWGSYLPNRFAAPPVDWGRLIAYVTTDPAALLGMPVAVAVMVVVPFLFMGGLLSQSGGGKFFTDICLAAFRRSPGGPAKVAIVSSSLLGTVSGSAVANVATSGIITIPMMKRAGYSSERAAAIEAVSSTGAQFVPPVMGAAAFIMAEFLQIPFATIALAAVLPTVLFFLIIYVNVHLVACRDGTKSPEADVASAQTFWTYFRSGWHAFFGLFLLFFLLLGLRWRPEAAAFAAALFYAISGMTLGYLGKRIHLRQIADNFRTTGLAATDIILVSAAAGIIIGVLSYSGLTLSLSRFLLFLSFDIVPLLILYTALAAIVLGLGMPTTGVYVLLAVLMAPALVTVGIDPLAAHFFIFYFGVLSMITPPVALAAFSAASIADARPMRTAVECVVVGWPLFILPFLMIIKPSLLMTQGWQDGVLIFVQVLVCFIAIAAGSIGYLRTPLSPSYRLLLGVLSATFIALQLLNFAESGLVFLISFALLGLLVFPYLRPRRLGVVPV